MFNFSTTEDHTSALSAVQERAHRTALHLMHDHPLTNKEREQGEHRVRKRSRLHGMPRLWHRRWVYMYLLRLRNPLWLGVDGIVYGEENDWVGGYYFLEAEIWRREIDGLERLHDAILQLDPCHETASQ